MKLLQIATDVKTTGAVSTVTISAGAGKWFGWIPSDVGLFGVLVGAFLSIVLAISHIIKTIREHRESELRQRETELRIKLLESQINHEEVTK